MRMASPRALWAVAIVVFLYGRHSQANFLTDPDLLDTVKKDYDELKDMETCKEAMHGLHWMVGSRLSQPVTSALCVGYQWYKKIQKKTVGVLSAQSFVDHLVTGKQAMETYTTCEQVPYGAKRKSCEIFRFYNYFRNILGTTQEDAMEDRLSETFLLSDHPCDVDYDCQMIDMETEKGNRQQYPHHRYEFTKEHWKEKVHDGEWIQKNTTSIIDQLNNTKNVTWYTIPTHKCHPERRLCFNGCNSARDCRKGSRCVSNVCVPLCDEQEENHFNKVGTAGLCDLKMNGERTDIRKILEKGPFSDLPQQTNKQAQSHDPEVACKHDVCWLRYNAK